MESENISKITDIAAYAGKILLACGSDIVRVEDTIRHIMISYGVNDFEVFTLTNGIFLSSCGIERTVTADGVKTDIKKDYLRVHNVPLVSTNLGKLDRVNTLSRRIATGTVSPDEAYNELCEIDTLPHFPAWLRMLASGAASGSICYMFGGSVFDSLAACLVGFLYYILCICLDESKLSRLLVNIICGSVITLLAYSCIQLGFGDSMNWIIIGAIMPLVPGVSFTNAIRDLAAGDYISGIVRLTDALIVAIGIAVGVGATVGVMNFFGLMSGVSI